DGSDWQRNESPADRVLSAAVPSHSRERWVVGERLHRVDQRRPSQAALSGSLSAPLTGGPGLLRPPPPGDTDGPGRTCRRIWCRGLLLLALLVPRQALAREALQRSAVVRPARFSVLPRLGERTLVAPLGRRRGRRPPGPDILSRRRQQPHSLAGSGIRRSALYPGRRPPFVPDIYPLRPS